MTRDMTRAQFLAACERAGWVREPMCYYRLAPPVDNTAVCILNGGDSYRDRLAYLHAEQAKHEQREAIR
jgi:hypothetical protein